MATRMTKQRQSDGNGLASAVPPIGGNNQLMLTVGAESTRERDNFRGWKDRKGSRWK
jgi:hypothetical protein